MTSRERFFCALDRKEPDRVPLFELTINPKVIDQISPGASYYDFIEEFDYDAVGPNLTWDALGRVRWVDEANGIFVDRWGVTRHLTAELIPAPVDAPIKTKDDLLRYKVPDPAEEPLLKLLPELIDRFRGKKATFILGRDAWTGSYMVRGMTEFLTDLVMNPAMAQDIIRMQVDYYKEVHRLAIEMGLDMIALVDDYAYKSGPFISPKLFRKFILPAFQDVVHDIKRHGAYCLKHTDGDIWKIIDMLVDTDIDALGPLEPEANMVLSQVKERFGDRIAVIGNIDCDLLARGTASQITDAVRQLILTTSPGGGHILSSGNSITSVTKPENLLAMIQGGKTFGVYPISESPKDGSVA